MRSRQARHKRRRGSVVASCGGLRATGLLLLVFLLVCGNGCRTPVTLPPVNLDQPGWTVRSGQAVWHRKRGGEGVAGEILIATRSDGRAFVQFSKNPFPLVVAQSTTNAWSVEFPPQNQHYSGRGQPPGRIIFLQMPRVLSGEPPLQGWSWQKLKNGGERLENLSSGEALDVYLGS